MNMKSLIATMLGIVCLLQLGCVVEAQVQAYARVRTPTAQFVLPAAPRLVLPAPGFAHAAPVTVWQRPGGLPGAPLVPTPGVAIPGGVLTLRPPSPNEY